MGLFPTSTSGTNGGKQSGAKAGKAANISLVRQFTTKTQDNTGKKAAVSNRPITA